MQVATVALLTSALLGAGALAGCDRSRPASETGQTASTRAPATGHIRQATIPVEGMSCGSCVARLRRHLTSMDGVVEVAVSLERREATVRYTEGKLSADVLVTAIDRLGYKAGAPRIAPLTGGGP